MLNIFFKLRMRRFFKKAFKFNFPNGEEQLQAETIGLKSLLDNKLTDDECRSLLIRTKFILSFEENKNVENMIERTVARSGNKLSKHEAAIVLCYITEKMRKKEA